MAKRRGTSRNTVTLDLGQIVGAFGVMLAIVSTTFGVVTWGIQQKVSVLKEIVTERIALATDRETQASARLAEAELREVGVRRDAETVRLRASVLAKSIDSMAVVLRGNAERERAFQSRVAVLQRERDENSAEIARLTGLVNESVAAQTQVAVNLGRMKAWRPPDSLVRRPAESPPAAISDLRSSP